MVLQATLIAANGGRRAFGANPEPTLKEVGARAGCPIGIAAAYASLRDPAIAQAIVKQFNLLTASGLKWVSVHPESERYDFSEADWNVHFAEQHGMQIHGHNLCWNSPAGNPAWLGKTLSKSNARNILTSHITTVMKRYQGRISSWDVVNEPIVSWPVKTGGLYPGPWVAMLGSEYMDIAFDAARQADPGALRIMNVYAVEQGTPDDEKARGLVISWLKTLKSRGVPVQAVGIESHLDTSEPLANTAMQRFVGTIRDLGLQVMITELDVKENRASGTSHDWDTAVADYYHDYLKEVLSVIEPRAVIFWSLNDRWERQRRVQGLLQSNMSPRLALSSAIQALEQGLKHS